MEVFNKPRRDIPKLEMRFHELLDKHLREEIYREMQVVWERIGYVETSELLKWLQRSKEHWLVDGDGNIKFFHPPSLITYADEHD
ncbi:UNVERIFIED_CONTAM: hypothetical protein Slati_1479400 [Sesamum latifolium]|uniref:Uncharacterized protein n=1 Tax=Sesamum latifolium TaxID=2727402 RepID=A0AAW2X552_9LAMI